MPEALTFEPCLWSTNIREIAYDAGANELHVKFRNGGYYIYSAVPPEVHQGLMASDSKGKGLAVIIKGKYAFRKEADWMPPMGEA